MKSFMHFRRFKLGIAMVAALLVLGPAVVPFARASALVTNPAPTPKISFTFDDGLTSASTVAAPTLAKYGLTGTDYVITGCVGMTKTPNTCHADNDRKYMTWAQIKALKNTYGWEIGSHTVTHPYLATSDASDGQPNPLTQAQVVQELTNSKSALAAQGINATSFSTPYGDYNTYTLQEIAKLYATHRGFADQNNNDFPYNEYLLNDYQVQNPVTVAQVKAKIDDAITNKRWLVLTFHDIAAKASNNPDEYQYSTANLDDIAAYAKSKIAAGQLSSVNVSNGPVSSDTNMLTNGNFASGLTGWTTDNASAFKADSGNNGSYPEATHSVSLAAGASDSHLFSSKVSVSNTNTYLLKNFVNVKTLSKGELAFYVDEYNSTGNWISGQYLRAERSPWVENLNFTYTPSSAAVTQASLQVILTGGSGITGYIDNLQMFPLTNNTPPAAPTNLMSNSAFDSGISAGWTTDKPSAITADTAGNGSPNNPQNSVKLTSSSAQGHLFSPQIAVTPGKSYSLASYLNVKSLSAGEVAFYIDEYDANSKWISGQYKTGVSTTGGRDVNFTYTPSSASVAKASLQVIVTANPGITAYVDDIRWFAN